MTDCPDGVIRDLLPEYALGLLAMPEARLVEAHVASCAACAEELALLQSARAGLALGVSRVDIAAIAAALPLAPGARTARPMLRRAITRRTWEYAAAAGLVLAVGSGLVWQRATGGPSARVADSSHVRSPSPAALESAGTQDGITFGGGLSDLSVDDLQLLLGQMDSVKTLPSTDPESMTPVIAMNEGGKTL